MAWSAPAGRSPSRSSRALTSERSNCRRGPGRSRDPRWWRSWAPTPARAARRARTGPGADRRGLHVLIPAHVDVHASTSRHVRVSWSVAGLRGAPDPGGPGRGLVHGPLLTVTRVQTSPYPHMWTSICADMGMSWCVSGWVPRARWCRRHAGPGRSWWCPPRRPDAGASGAGRRGC